MELPLLPAHQALEDGGVLRVHGHDLRAALSGPGHDHVAGADQGLLVGQGDALFRVNGRQRRLQAHRAGHRRHDAVRLRQRGRLDQAAHAGAHADIRIGHGDLEGLGRLLVIDRHKGRMKLPRLLLQQIDLPVGGQGRDPDAGVLRHGGGLPADGAGAAENGNGSDHNSIPSYLSFFQRRSFRSAFCFSVIR